MFLGVCLWREKTAQAPIPLPFWSAPELYHHRLGLRIGLDWMAQFLECVTAAALIGLRELARLLEAEKKRTDIGATARSRLPDALDAVLRAPVVTAELSGENPSRDAAGGARLAAAADDGRDWCGKRPGGRRGGLLRWPDKLQACECAYVHTCSCAIVRRLSASPPLSR